MALAPTLFFFYSPDIEKLVAQGTINGNISLHQYDNLKNILNEEIANQPNEYGITPMAAAIIFDDKKAFSYLIDKGAKPQDQVRVKEINNALLGANELMIAVAMGRDFFVQKLLEMKSDPNALLLQVRKDTPLHISASKCYPAVTKLLLDYGAKIDTQNGLKKTPLHYAVSNKCYSTLFLLLGAQSGYGPQGSFSEESPGLCREDEDEVPAGK